jgi:hypothetical protein
MWSSFEVRIKERINNRIIWLFGIWVKNLVLSMILRLVA